MKDKIKHMMEELIAGNYNCNDFSYDMPELLLELKDAELEEALENVPEICANYDPYKTDETELLNDYELIDKIEEIYNTVFG